MREEDYFRLIQKGSAGMGRKKSGVKEGAVVCSVEDISALQGMDYIASEELVSDRLKVLLEAFMRDREWKAYVFVNTEKKEEKVFWKLEVDEYHPEAVGLDGKGNPTKLRFGSGSVPRIFKVVPEKGSGAIFLHLSALECMIRRGMTGLDWEEVGAFPEGVEMEMAEEWSRS